MNPRSAFKIALLGGLLATGACAHQHHPQGPRPWGGGPGLTPRGVSVVGVGEAKAAPDIARTSVGVEVRGPHAEQATAEANQRMAAVIAELKNAGIPDSDLRTHGFSISFEREFPPHPMPHEAAPAVEPKAGPKGERAVPAVAPVTAPAPAAVDGVYRVSNMVEVTIRDLQKVGQVLGAATRAGANQVWGLSFEVADPAPLRAQARTEAIAQAKQSAEQLAQLTGVKLGPIVSITDGVVQGGGPIGPMMAMRAEAADVPVERGELTITHQVQVVYGLPERPCGAGHKTK